MNAQPSAKYLSLIEAALRAGALATPDIGLFTNAITPSITTVLADLVEPAFTGYARAAATLGALRSNANGDLIDPYGSVTFQPSATPTPAETARGAFLVATITAVDWLLGSDIFLDASGVPAPFTFAATTDALDVLWDAKFTNVRAYGGVCATC